MSGSVSWVGDTTGTGNGNWNSPKDWSSGIEPSASASVTFALGGLLYTVTGGGSVASVTVDADNVTFDGAVNASALIGTDGAYVTIDPNALFDVAMEANFVAGTVLEVQGQLIDAGAVVDTALVDGPGAQWISSAPVNANFLQISDGATFAGDILLNDGGEVKLDPTVQFGGSTLTLAGAGSIYLANFPSTAPIGFAEAIDFLKAGSGLSLASDPGTVLNLAGPIGESGASTLTLDAYLNITGGTVELSGANNGYTGGTVVDGGATLQVDQTGGAGTGAIFLASGALVENGVQNGEVVVGASGNDTISGSGGGLVVFAGEAATLSYTGGGTGNLVLGGSGVLDAVGGSGGDTIFAGTSGRDVLQTGTGPTTLAGGMAGATLIATGAANNLLAAGGGNTTLSSFMATGDNVMFGAASGNTTIEGGLGTDTIVGGAGADIVYASAGTEDVFAGSGYLQLDFVAGFGGGTTNVVGFQTATDKLALVGFAPGAIEQVLAGAQVSGGNTELTLSDGSKLIFWGTTGIGAGNFV